MLRFLRMLMQLVVVVVDGVSRLVIRVATGRDIAAEAAEEATQAAQAEAQARDVAAKDVEAEARHQELVAVVERLSRRQAAPVEPTVRPKRVADRRREIAAQSRSHDPVIRSSQWTADEADVDAAAELRVA